jgi:dipeptidyl aminopeptidase/acylaminoacyl peptidase
VRTPLFIIHGKQDIYVPHQQSVDMAERVRANGVEVEHQSQDGHGFVDAESLLTACRDTGAFLLRHLSQSAGPHPGGG